MSDIDDLRSWVAVRYALLLRYNASAFAPASVIAAEFEKRTKFYLIDESTWGVTDVARAGQRGLEDLMSQQSPPNN